MRGDPRGVPLGTGWPRFTRAKIRQNLFWAFAYNAVGLPLAAFGPGQPDAGGRGDGGETSVSVVTRCAVAAAEDCETGLGLLLVPRSFHG